MTFQAKAIKIMIASPSDIKHERQLIREVIHEWNTIHATHENIVLLPVGWETDSSPEMGDRPQEIINKQILKDSDILVAVFWTRLGTPTGKQKSGTVEEIMEHYKAGKPTMVYFSNTPVEMGSVDRSQYDELMEFKKWCEDNGLIHEYSTLSDFKSLFNRHLAQRIISDFASKEVHHLLPEPEQPTEDLTAKYNYDINEDSKALLLEASEDPNGAVLKIRTMGGVQIITNSKNFVERGNPRSTATWEGAVEELCDYGLLQSQGFKGEVYTITSKGYEFTDWLKLRTKT